MREFVRGLSVVAFAACAIVVVGASRAAAPVIDSPLLPLSAVLGGTGSDAAASAVFGPDGALWIAAGSYSKDLPGAPRPTNRSGDVVVLRFDPVTHAVLSSAWLGSSGYDSAVAIAIDGDGNAFLAANSSYDSSHDIAGAKSFGTPGEHHGIVARLKPDGSGFAWIALIDGEITGLAVTAGGDPVVCGNTSSDAHPLKNPIRAAPAGAFVTRIRSDGSALAFSTYLGGSGNDRAWAIAAGPGGELLVTGGTNSPDFPVTGRLLGTPTGRVEGFLAEIDAQETQVTRAVLLGDTIGLGVEASPDGLLLLGQTKSADFPAARQPHGPPGDDGDACLLRLDPADWSIHAAALFGGSASEYYLSMSRAPDGTVWVGGSTTSADLPVPGAVQPLLGSNEDAFVAAFAADDLSPLYATYLGGDERELGNRIVAAADGAAWLVGATWSSNFPLTAPVQPLSPPNSEYDMFVARFLRGDPALAPAAPTGFAADVLGGNSVRLRWDAGPADGTYFAVYRRQSSGFGRIATVDGGTTEFVDTTVLPLRKYEYFVQALNDSGGSSATATVTVQPPATLDVTVSAGRARFIPDWFDGTSRLVLRGTIARTAAAAGAPLDPRRDGIEWVVDDAYYGYYGAHAVLVIPANDRRWRRVRHGWVWRSRQDEVRFDPETGRFVLRVGGYGGAVFPGLSQWTIRATIGKDAGSGAALWRSAGRRVVTTP